VKDDTYTTTIDVACKYGLIVTAGKGGRIDIIKDDNATTIPEIKDGKLELKRGPRGENDYGAYVTTSNDESLAWEIVKAIITTGGSGSNPWVEHLQRAILSKYNWFSAWSILTYLRRHFGQDQKEYRSQSKRDIR